MEDKKTFIDPLFERVEEYCKTSFELTKLKTVDKGADIASTFISYGIMAPVFLIVMLFTNIGIALWLGNLLDKLYDGFFCVAAFYVVVGFVLYFLRNPIKRRINNSIVLQITN